MSSKTQSKQSKPRKIPQMEAIITRHKSAQLRRQLRNKQETVTRINQMTQLLRSPITSRNELRSFTNSFLQKTLQASPTKTRNAPKPSAKKVNNEPKTPEKRKRRVSESKGGKEYYPNRVKRKVDAKKVLLKPKHDLQVIGRPSVSKRKLTVPQKDIKTYASKCQRADPTPSASLYSAKLKSPHSELSVEEIVRLTDESESLNDDDWLEILTCPSPVWWEDPPDARYCEDAIRLRKITFTEGQKNSIKSDDNKISIEEANSNTNTSNRYITDTNISKTKQTDDKFMNKRNKLENLLGSLKNKLGCAEVPLGSDNLSRKIKNDNVNNVSVVETELNNSETNEKGNVDVSSNKRKDKRASAQGDGDVNNKKRETRTSESTEGDDPFSNLRDDDLLNDLENLDIPIEPEMDTNAFVNDVSKPSSSKKSFLDSGEDLQALNPHLVQIQKSFSKKSMFKNVTKKKISKLKCDDVKTVIAKAMNIASTYNKDEKDPTTSKNPLLKYSNTSKVVLAKNLDTNKGSSKIKLRRPKKRNRKITTNEFDEHNMKTKVTAHKNTVLIQSKESKEKSGDTRYMTVYKIISNNESVSTEVKVSVNTTKLTDGSTTSDKEHSIPLDAVKNRLDSFYKKFKNTYQRRPRKQEIKLINNNSVSQIDNKAQVEIIPNDVASESINVINVVKATEHRTIDQSIEKENDESSLCDPVKGQKAIVVSNKNRVKYCLKCSCIFDTEYCAYCVRKMKWGDESVSDSSLCVETVVKENND